MYLYNGVVVIVIVVVLTARISILFAFVISYSYNEGNLCQRNAMLIIRVMNY